MRQIDVVAFDAYGTLFDVHSVVAAAEAAYPGHGTEISELWRNKQLQYTWLRSMMERYRPFSEVTRAALRFTLRDLDLPYEREISDRLMDAYLHLDPFPDTAKALPALRPRQLWIFSNGDPAMLEPLAANSGLDTLLDGLISVDDAAVFKPSPRCYALIPQRLGVPSDRILLVSSNSFDVAGAASFGLATAWIRRTHRTPEALDLPPDIEVDLLTDLPAALS